MSSTITNLELLEKEETKKSIKEAKEAEKKSIKEAKEAEKQGAKEAKEAEKKSIKEAKEAEKKSIKEAKEAEKQAAKEAKEAKEEKRKRVFAKVVEAAADMTDRNKNEFLKEVAEKMGMDKTEFAKVIEGEIVKKRAMQAKEAKKAKKAEKKATEEANEEDKKAEASDSTQSTYYLEDFDDIFESERKGIELGRYDDFLDPENEIRMLPGVLKASHGSKIGKASDLKEHPVKLDEYMVRLKKIKDILSKVIRHDKYIYETRFKANTSFNISQKRKKEFKQNLDDYKELFIMMEAEYEEGQQLLVSMKSNSNSKTKSRTRTDSTSGGRRRTMKKRH